MIRDRKGRVSMMCCFTLSTCGVWSQDMEPCVPSDMFFKSQEEQGERMMMIENILRRFSYNFV